jgi:hypothetical protein
MSLSLGEAIKGDFKPFEQLMNAVEDCVFKNQDDPEEGLLDLRLLQRELQQTMINSHLSEKQVGAVKRWKDLIAKGISTIQLLKTMNQDFASILRDMIQVREEFSPC